MPTRPKMLRLCFVASLVCLSLFVFTASAQTTGTSASCSIRSAAYTEAEISFFNGEYRKAATLAAAAYKTDPDDRRDRQLEIHSLLALNKVDEAGKLADAWIATSPQDAYAMQAMSDLRHAHGEWLDAYALALKSAKADPCNARIYNNIAIFETHAGYRVSARKHLELAHQLSPKDDNLTLAWIQSLPRREAADQLQNFLQTNTSLDAKSREDLQQSLRLKQAIEQDKCQLNALHGPAVIPMVPIHSRHTPGIESYGLEVAFNGHKRVLQIDTGASGVLLTHSAATGMGLGKVDVVQVGGFGAEGPSGATIQTAVTLQIGALEFGNCVVETLNNFGVMGGSHLEGAHLDDSQGLIGTDVFERYAVTLDYIKHQIRLEPLPRLPNSAASTAGLDALGGNNDLSDWNQADRYIAPEMKTWAKIYRSGHELIAPAILNRQIPALFMLDTGAFANLIREDLAKRVTTSQNTDMYSRGFSGTSNVGESGQFTLDFAGVRLPVKGMNTMKNFGFGGVSGFIGYTTLEHLVLHIDYRDNLVLIEAPPQR